MSLLSRKEPPEHAGAVVGSGQQETGSGKRQAVRLGSCWGGQQGTQKPHAGLRPAPEGCWSGLGKGGMSWARLASVLVGELG